MPSITSAEATASGISWEADRSLEAADVVRATASWFHAATTQRGRWRIFAPPDARSPLAYPQLPGQFADRVPPGDATFDDPLVIVVDVDNIPGYEEYRRGSGLQLFGADPPPAGVTIRAAFHGVL